MEEKPEAWLRGAMPGVHPLVAPTLFAFQQAREDLAKHTEGLTREQIWGRPHGFGPVGFHLRHIAGATGRLTAYLQGRQLTAEELTAAKAEQDPSGPGREELLKAIDGAFARAEQVLRSLDANQLTEPREVGRKKLPTTVIGLAVHMAEHTARHLGQAINAAKLARVSSYT